LLFAEPESGSSKRLDLGGQAALGTRCLVLVDDLLVGDAVKDSNGLLEDALSGGFVARFDGLTDTLDRGTQGRTRAGVAGALYVCLTGCAALRRQLAQHLRVRLRYPEQSLSGP
jgi:hypothetical protein